LLIILAGVFGGLLGLIVAKITPVKYIASATISVSKRLEPATDGSFSYEGFYASQTADKFSETVFGILKSESLAASVLSNLSYPITHETLKNFMGALFVRKAAPSLLYVEVTETSRGGAEKLGRSLLAAMEEEVSKISTEGNLLVKVSVIGNGLVVKEEAPNPVLFVILGAMVGFVVTVTKIVLWKI